MKELFRKLVSIWSAFFLFPLKLIRCFYIEKKIVEEFMIQLCRNIEKGTGLYISHYLRPVKPVIEYELPAIDESGLVAVVMQGPIMYEDEFTLNTIRFYKQVRGNLQIIVSTWETENQEIIQKMKQEGAIVIISRPPEYGGIGNINYQLVSMQAGIKRALEMNAEYICKSRTDQRISHPYAFPFLINLLKEYPIFGESKMNKRIIALATEYGSMFEPYYISDFFYFGHRKDMERMLDIPLNQRKILDRANMTRKMLAEEKGTAEIYIIKSFFENCGVTCENSILGYWTILKNFMILIDKPLIRLYWPKYDARYCEHVRDGSYSTRMGTEKNGLSNFDFLSWLSLTNDELMYKEEYEEYLDLRL